jgi:hypothetical protein
MVRLQLLGIYLVFLVTAAHAANVDFDFALSFSDPVWVSHEYRTDLDCDSEIGFNIGDEAYLKRDLVAAGVRFSSSSPFKLRLYVTHHDCGSTGKESYRSYPLGLGHKERDSSSAYLRVISEIENKASGEIISIREFISVAKLENNSSQFLFFHFGTEKVQAQMSDLWKPIAAALAQGINEDLRR